eukprot:g72274.t1
MASAVKRPRHTNATTPRRTPKRTHSSGEYCGAKSKFVSVSAVTPSVLKTPALHAPSADLRDIASPGDDYLQLAGIETCLSPLSVGLAGALDPRLLEQIAQSPRLLAKFEQAEEGILEKRGLKRARMAQSTLSPAKHPADGPATPTHERAIKLLQRVKQANKERLASQLPAVQEQENAGAVSEGRRAGSVRSTPKPQGTARKGILKHSGNTPKQQPVSSDGSPDKLAGSSPSKATDSTLASSRLGERIAALKRKTALAGVSTGAAPTRISNKVASDPAAMRALQKLRREQAAAGGADNNDSEAQVKMEEMAARLQAFKEKQNRPVQRRRSNAAAGPTGENSPLKVRPTSIR